MYHVTVNHLRFSIPSAWHELTLSQAVTFLSEEVNDRELLVLLSGVDELQFRALKVEALLTGLAPMFRFLGKVPDFPALPVPEELYMPDGRLIDVPDRSDLWTTGQKWDIDEELKQMEADEVPVNFITTARLLLSVLLAPRITERPYQDIAQAQAIFPIIDQLPATDALALSAFFLTSYLTPISSGQIKWTEVTTIRTRSRLDYLRRVWRRLIRFMLRKP